MSILQLSNKGEVYTLGFINGLDTKIIKSITGHKKDSTFDKYLKVSDDFKKEKLFEAWGKM